MIQNYLLQKHYFQTPYFYKHVHYSITPNQLYSYKTKTVIVEYIWSLVSIDTKYTYIPQMLQHTVPEKATDHWYNDFTSYLWRKTMHVFLSKRCTQFCTDICTHFVLIYNYYSNRCACTCKVQPWRKMTRFTPLPYCLSRRWVVWYKDKLYSVYWSLIWEWAFGHSQYVDGK